MTNASCWSRLSLSLPTTDRIGLLGANGNGKSTFAKLLAGASRLARQGRPRASARSRVFAQHNRRSRLERHALCFFARLMPDAPQARVRAWRRAPAFPAPRPTPGERLSGGEKPARPAARVASFRGPHLNSFWTSQPSP